jgi:hypothetical protein
MGLEVQPFQREEYKNAWNGVANHFATDAYRFIPHLAVQHWLGILSIGRSWNRSFNCSGSRFVQEDISLISARPNRSSREFRPGGRLDGYPEHEGRTHDAKYLRVT